MSAALDTAGRLIGALPPTVAALGLVIGVVVGVLIAYDAITSARVEEARARFWAPRPRRVPAAAPRVKVEARRVEALER